MSASTLETTLNLLDLSDEAFGELVNQDVRGGLDPTTSSQLRTPELAERWYDNLLRLKRSVEAQLASNRAEQTQKLAECMALGPPGRNLWLQFRGNSERWRAGAVRFKNGVEDKLAEAKALRKDARNGDYTSLVIGERDSAIKEAMRLRGAILQHKACVDLDEEDPAVVDERLWDVVETDSHLH